MVNYGIHYVCTNIVAKERFSIGLIAVHNNKAYFEYSKDKILKLSNVFDISSTFIIDILENINDKVNEVNMNNNGGKMFCELGSMVSSWNNLIQVECNYMHPLCDFNDALFDKLYNKMVLSKIKE